jgi:hypothetical protein
MKTAAISTHVLVAPIDVDHHFTSSEPIETLVGSRCALSVDQAFSPRTLHSFLVFG